MSRIFNPNSCGCFATEVISPCDSPSDDCCLTVCNILSEKRMNPCASSENNSDSLNITSFIKIPSCCSAPNIVTKIEEHTNNLKNVTFVYNTLLKTFTVSYEANYSAGKDWKTAKIVYSVKCGILKLNAEIVIPFLQLVDNASCPGGYDPCTGLCIPIPDEISVSGTTTNNVTIS